jgi:hypothetical protein
MLCTIFSLFCFSFFCSTIMIVHVPPSFFFSSIYIKYICCWFGLKKYREKINLKISRFPHFLCLLCSGFHFALWLLWICYNFYMYSFFVLMFIFFCLLPLFSSDSSMLSIVTIKFQMGVYGGRHTGQSVLKILYEKEELVCAVIQ